MFFPSKLALKSLTFHTHALLASAIPQPLIAVSVSIIVIYPPRLRCINCKNALSIVYQNNYAHKLSCVAIAMQSLSSSPSSSIDIVVYHLDALHHEHAAAY